MVRAMTSWRSKPARRRNPQEIEALVLEAIAAADGPISAYDIADVTSRAGSPLVPNQVYRTLGRLIEQGRVQRIESLNAYLLRDNDADACMICNDCHRVRLFDVPELRAIMSRAAGAAGFSLEQHVIEIHGHCATCSADLHNSEPISRSKSTEDHHARQSG
ncbi:transcriptional repressor [Sphingobium yanoikuyae]|uniref:Transcriptional repressor n=1 Tax=Sphingobium yanoikuyae TaxID=13690 RepID=A0A6P1GM26_SPHYA|nr:Fur family transcriptional regulator [Sphingobium yanoikuyae]QHD69635.1 transcriptional repressor [Sphingobium yanoikuyae]